MSRRRVLPPEEPTMPDVKVTYHATDPASLTLSNSSVAVKGPESVTWTFEGVPTGAAISIQFGSGCPFNSNGRTPAAVYNATGGENASVTTPAAGPITNGDYPYTVSTTDKRVQVVCDGTVVVTGNP
jgi:hypothetical protein